MSETFGGLNPVLQALLAGLFTWGVTALGAAAVFFKKEFNRHLLNGMLGFAAGVMIAASFWSLLAPSIAMSAGGPMPKWLPALIGFLLGGAFLWLMDKLLPHLHRGLSLDKAEGIKTRLQTSALLVLAITLHNIPEGLSIGVAFGAAGAGLPGYAFAGAVALAVGIGIQDVPEGIAVS
ncbi:MAG: ZIP family metal transporter, partial [Candidatus Aminicenantes bacterium]|nr:ZIP family metal transporter [Candidatus Aminicenantes bacterium]